MVRLNDAWTNIGSVLNEIDEDYTMSCKLACEGVISGHFAGFLQAFLRMKSYLDVADLFLDDEDIEEARVRIGAAGCELSEICQVYNSFSPWRHELALYARNVYAETFEKYEKLLEESGR